MSRWKAPRPKSSPYITPKGYQTLESELKNCWEKRKHVVKAITAAAAEGDRSENAEYIYRKKELRGIDSRINFLQKRLPTLTIVSKKPDNQDCIYFGAMVTLEKENGEEVTYRIVGPDEHTHKKYFISMDSPLAKALLKKSCDEEVIINNEIQQMRYFIVEIRYES
ncbi:MAG: transcription elongation factor GreB [Methylococcaceae bacterium]|nr:transcription elongation factor GreB [Methylococcaceae bacterium]